MRDATPRGTRPGRALPLFLLAAVLAGACAPEQSQSGYDTVTHRGGPPPLPEASHPQPPAVPAGTQLGGGPAQTITLQNLPEGVTQEMIQRGQEQFAMCAACHGQGGAGTPAGPALNDGQWLNIDGSYPSIVAVINNGVPQPKQFPGMMPPRGGGQFTAEQVNDIAAYVYAISHQGE